MYCTKCGKKLGDNSNFCKYCGNPVRQKQRSLLERARAQEQDALEEIYNQSCSAVYRVIKVLIKEEDTVYDILQDTYIKAFTRLDQLQDESKLVPWLKTIANNTAKDWLKKSKPILFTDMSADKETDVFSFEESIEDERKDVNPEIAIDEQEVRRLIFEILDQLPEEQRMIIGMFYYEEMSVKDIASTLGISDNTVKSRLAYGRKKIKELVLELEKKGTKLYTVAPLTFFIYLLRRLERDPADFAETSILHKTMVSNVKSAETSGKNVQTANDKNLTNREVIGTAEKTAAKIAPKAAGAVGKKVVGHVGAKAVALVLAGAVGVGGIYGVLNNTDRLSFFEEDSTKEKDGSVQDKDTIQPLTETPAPTPTQIPTETPTPTQAAEKIADVEKSDEDIYQKFYQKYIQDENLQVVDNGYCNIYNDPYENGYTDSMLLSAYVDDFGGDGQKELLLIRTKDEATEVNYGDFVYSETRRKIYAQLYGIDEQNVVLRHSLELPNSNLSNSAAYITEQIKRGRTDHVFYLYRYAMAHGSTGGGSYENTIIKVTDTGFLQEHNMYYSSSGMYQNEGWCEIDGTDCYTGNIVQDKELLNSILQQYGLAAFNEIDMPDLLDFHKNENFSDTGIYWEDTFFVNNCFKI